MLIRKYNLSKNKLILLRKEKYYFWKYRGDFLQLFGEIYVLNSKKKWEGTKYSLSWSTIHSGRSESESEALLK